MKPFLPNTIPLLEMLGFRFGLGWDDELEIEAPMALDPHRVVELLEEYRGEIEATIRYRAKVDRERLNGGPFHGRRNDWHSRYVVDASGKRAHFFEGIRCAWAKWAVYKIVPDGRAFFQGYATSQRKARRGEIDDSEKPEPKSKPK